MIGGDNRLCPSVVVCLQAFGWSGSCLFAVGVRPVFNVDFGISKWDPVVRVLEDAYETVV